jgi:uncharacterized cupin superfamily protein
MTNKRVIHTGDLSWDSDSAGAHFARRQRRVSDAAGGRDLGCTMVELEAGKTARPFLYRTGNEEALYVLGGHGTLRIGSDRLPLREGDYVALPPGPDTAHQVTNTGQDLLRYLLIETRRGPDVAVYPDSGKVGLLGDPTGAPDRFFEASAAVDRWHGEPIGVVEPEAAPPPGADPAEKVAAAEAARRQQEAERRIDDEIREMKRKLDLDQARPGPGPEATPPPASPTGPGKAGSDGNDIDDIDALKRKLDA